MRPLLVLILTVGLLAGTKWFLALSATDALANAEIVLIPAPGEYSVDLTLSFDAGPDEFSLDVDDAPSLIVQLNGEEVLKRTDTVSASDSPVVLENVSGVVVGTNEFYLQASPSELGIISTCIRVRVLRDGAMVAEDTLWSEPGEAIQGVVRMEVSQ